MFGQVGHVDQGTQTLGVVRGRGQGRQFKKNAGVKKWEARRTTEPSATLCPQCSHCIAQTLANTRPTSPPPIPSPLQPPLKGAGHTGGSQAKCVQQFFADINAPYSPLASSFEMGPLIVQAGRARTRTLRPGPFWLATEAGCFLRARSTAQQQGVT